MRSSSGHPTMSSLGGTGRTHHSDLGDWSDPALDDDVVQPSNESRRTAPPEEPAADHAIHVEGGTAAPSNHSPMIGLIYRVSPHSSVQLCTFCAIRLESKLEPCNKSA